MVALVVLVGDREVGDVLPATLMPSLATQPAPATHPTTESAPASEPSTKQAPPLPKDPAATLPGTLNERRLPPEIVPQTAPAKP
jgi:hypothetical protein